MARFALILFSFFVPQLALIYLGVAFVTLQLDPTIWDRADRGGATAAVFVALLISALIGAVASAPDDD